MKQITKDSQTFWWIVLIMFASEFLSQNINFIILVLVFIYLFMLNGFKVSFNMPGKTVYLVFILMGMLTGIMYVTQYGHSQYVFFKHIYFCIMVPLYWIDGFLMIKVKNISRIGVVKSIIFGAIVYSLYDLFKVLTRLSEISGLSIYYFRNLVGGVSIVPIIGLYLLFFYGSDLKIYKTERVLFYLIFSLSVLVHFSRISIVELSIFILFSGIKFNIKKIIRIVIMMTMGVALMSFVLPNVFVGFYEKILNSLTELSFNKSVWTHNDIVTNWRGYEAFCAIQQFNNSGIIKQLFGSGFGTFIDVKGYAYLVTKEENLSMLHNGYFSILIFWGLSGVVLFFGWIISIFRCNKDIIYRQDQCFVKGMSVLLLFVNYFIMGPFFSRNVACYLFYISLFYSLSVINKYSIKNNSKTE